jgi:uncharacterized protein with GYD domain
MPKYLFLASYTAEGTKGVLKDGGTKRRDNLARVVKGLGGKLEAFYFAFGEHDAVSIVDLPDNVTTAAVSMAINATGAVNAKTVVLLTPAEMDAATKKIVRYSPPGAKKK